MNTKNSRKKKQASPFFFYLRRKSNLSLYHPSQDLPAYLEKWGLGDAGFKYNVVAVFGSQSTGKSKSAFFCVQIQSRLTRFFF